MWLFKYFKKSAKADGFLPQMACCLHVYCHTTDAGLLKICRVGSIWRKETWPIHSLAWPDPFCRLRRLSLETQAPCHHLRLVHTLVLTIGKQLLCIDNLVNQTRNLLYTRVRVRSVYMPYPIISSRQHVNWCGYDGRVVETKMEQTYSMVSHCVILRLC